MRKSKKLLSIALVPCIVWGVLAGCTASSENVRKTIEKEDDANKAGGEQDSEAPVEEPADFDQTAAFVDLLRSTSDMEAYSRETKITVHQTAANGTETEVKLNVKTRTDGRGNSSFAVGVDLDEAYFDMPIKVDLFAVSKVDDCVYLDFTGTYDIMMNMLDKFTQGEADQQMEQSLSAYDITLDELESMLVLEIPVGDADISKSISVSMEDTFDLLYADMEAAIDSLGDDFLTHEGNTYTLTVNNDNLVDVTDAFIDAFEGNMDEIYDECIDAVKKTNYPDQLETVLRAILDGVMEEYQIDENIELSKEERDMIEAASEVAHVFMQNIFHEMIGELEDGKDDLLDEVENAIADYRDEKENIRSTMEDSGNLIKCVLKVTSEGQKGARTITREMTAASYAADTETNVTIGINSVITEGEAAIREPKKYATYYELAKLLSKVSANSEKGNQDNGNRDYGLDKYWNTDSYTQAELAEIYGVKLKKNQAIAFCSTDLPAVLITAYDDMEIFMSDIDTSRFPFQMETSDSALNYIKVSVYDSSFDKEYVEAVYDGKELDDNKFYIEDEDELKLYIFEKNITINIEFETYEDDGLVRYTNWDNEGFMMNLAELCEVIPVHGNKINM